MISKKAVQKAFTMQKSMKDSGMLWLLSYMVQQTKIGGVVLDVAIQCRLMKNQKATISKKIFLGFCSRLEYCRQMMSIMIWRTSIIGQTIKKVYRSMLCKMALPLSELILTRGSLGCPGWNRLLCSCILLHGFRNSRYRISG